MKRDIQSRQCERALLIGLKGVGELLQTVEAHVRELNGLVNSLEIAVVSQFIVSLRQIHPRWLIGTGNVEEIGRIILEDHVDLVVFDADLTPTQQRNLEREWHTAVIDRPEVILDIFADRASSREAVLQVALARMQYSLPRLTRAWTHLSRQRGGAHGTRGKGETQLETDRRLVMDKIARLKNDLVKVKAQRETRRRKRLERPVPSVALVGYTNAGKSSLLNVTSGANVYVEDKLFATLDPTTRRIEQPGGREFVLTDTVGFIRKLPHDLVDAFKSTLEEALLSDVILHVADASSSELDEHITVTRNVLNELGAGDTARILVLNKMDNLLPEEVTSIRVHYPDACCISTHTGYGLENLYQRLGDMLDNTCTEVALHLPLDRWDLRARLHRVSTVIKEDCDESGIHIRACLSPEERSRLSEYEIEETQCPT